MGILRVTKGLLPAMQAAALEGYTPAMRYPPSPLPCLGKSWIKPSSLELSHCSASAMGRAPVQSENSTPPTLHGVQEKGCKPSQSWSSAAPFSFCHHTAEAERAVPESHQYLAAELQSTPVTSQHQAKEKAEEEIAAAHPSFTWDILPGWE